ncbi:MAG TPA: hypothetical protein VN859_08325 [Steroidobacteraceae bacterium]|nr:hypothetical protein [Steroidobacteraceae bacterium]
MKVGASTDAMRSGGVSCSVPRAVLVAFVAVLLSEPQAVSTAAAEHAIKALRNVIMPASSRTLARKTLNNPRARSEVLSEWRVPY